MPNEATAHSTPYSRIRPAEIGDWNFINATWAQSHWRESPWANRIRWNVYSARHKPIIQRLLGRSAVLVACDPSHPEEILGYFVFEHALAVHFCYVKPPFRKAGVARALLEASGLPQDLAGIAVTHPTRAWFTRPPFTEKGSGRLIRPESRGIEEQFPQSIHDPYLWMERP